MRKLKADLDRLKATLEEKNPSGAEALRFAEVNDLWRNAVGAVFGGDSADLVLDHTNSVYVMSGEQGGNLRRFDRPRSETQGSVAGKVLAVYCDDSMVRSELDNRQELLKMKFKEQGAVEGTAHGWVLHLVGALMHGGQLALRQRAGR
ncbi:hypothetical protein GO744_07335, partial [Gordonibacter sp. ResAG-50]|nr:hypothetical protein [Gordonibacter urolithinfaciens]